MISEFRDALDAWNSWNSSHPTGAFHPTVLAILLLGAGIPAVFAHTGSSGIRVEQETVIAIREDGIAIEYASQLNRQGAYLEVLRMDLDGDGKLSPQEEAHYFAKLEKAIAGGLELHAGGKEIPLEPIGEVELSMPLGTEFRKTYRFEVPHPPDWQQGATVEFHNDNYLDFRGNITITLDPGSRADVVYDSRWERTAEEDAALPAGPYADLQQRDLVFRYCRGSGNSEPPEDWKPAAVETGAETEAEPPVSPGARPLLRPFVLVVSSVALVLCVIIVAIGLANGVAAGRWITASAAILATAGGLLAWEHFAAPWRRAPQIAMPSEVQAGQIFQRLHRNIYRAFEARSESEIYAALARGLRGEVLDEVYNEVYQALMIRGEGNTRFSVRRVKPISTRILPADDDDDAPAFRVRYRWRVYGTVTHFGHTHARFNEYQALYLVKHDGRAWYITGTQVRQNKRVTVGQS